MKKILIVDDDSDLLKLYKQAFLNAAFEVDTTLKLSEAETMVKKETYDVILLDMMFPDTDALNTIRTIRSSESPNQKTPILVLTNLSSKEKTKKAIDLGANECLFKAGQTPSTIFQAALRLSDNTSS